MKKLIAIIASVMLFCSLAYADTEVNAGIGVKAAYTSKLIEFGAVTNPGGVYTAGAYGEFESFSVGFLAYNSIDLSPTSVSLQRVDMYGAYKFTSTLADVTLGTTYVHVNSPGKLDFSGHWRPFVSVGKNIYSITWTYDTQSRLANFEGRVQKSAGIGSGFALVPGIFAGYTDVADALPKSVKEISYTNAYYGGNLDLTWKMLGVGGFVLRDNHVNKTTTGYKAYASYRF